MIATQPNNPLHGITLKAVLEALVRKLGWSEQGNRTGILCFQHNPSFNSCLKFLRKTDWARSKVEALFLESQGR